MELNEKLLVLQTIIKSTGDVLGECDAKEKKQILNSIIKNTLQQIGLNEEIEQQVVQEGDIVTIVFAEYLDYYNYKICPGITQLEQNKLLNEDFGYSFAIHWMSALGIAIIGAKVDEEIKVELRENDCEDLKVLYPDIIPGIYHIRITKIEKTKDSRDVKNPMAEYEKQQSKCYISPEERQKIINQAKMACNSRMATQIKLWEEEIHSMHMDTVEAAYARTRARYNRVARLRDVGIDLRTHTSYSSDDE